MKGARKTDPLWLRALKDPEAQKWLAKHKKEFPTESFLPDPIAFKDKIVLAREKVASIIADGMPYEDPEQQQLAKLVLQHTPRVIAKRLQLSRREVYLRIRALKRAAIRKWKEKREAAIMARSASPSLPEAPQRAIKTIRFRSGGYTEQVAYLVAVGRRKLWFDAHGAPFSEEVQDILNNLELYQVEFEVLEVENAKED